MLLKFIKLYKNSCCFNDCQRYLCPLFISSDLNLPIHLASSFLLLWCMLSNDFILYLYTALVAAVLKAAAQNEPLPSREPPPLPRQKTVTIPGTKSAAMSAAMSGGPTPGATGPILGRNKSNSTPSLSAGEIPEASSTGKGETSLNGWKVRGN